MKRSQVMLRPRRWAAVELLDVDGSEFHGVLTLAHGSCRNKNLAGISPTAIS